MIYFLLVMILVVIVYYYKKREDVFVEKVFLIFNSIKEKKRLGEVPEILESEYINTIKSVVKQELELENSLKELRDYRHELEITYNSLVKKSSQLEYTNSVLKHRIENLSNLNFLLQKILSNLNLNKMIDIIVDAYFILTSAERVALYLWEDSDLICKKTKGECHFHQHFYDLDIDNYLKIYEDISKNFRSTPNEMVIVSPLIINHLKLGVIFIIEDKDKYAQYDKEIIKALALQASVCIRSVYLYQELLQKERIANELAIANRIQKKILPTNISHIFGLDICSYFQPAKEMGGDFYDYNQINDNIFNITIADVSGKGIPAAFLMAVVRSMLKTLVLSENKDPNVDLNRLNKIVFSDITEDMFVTVQHIKYHKNTHILSFSNAGHNPFVWYRKRDNKITLCNTKGVAIGFLEEYNYKSSQIQLEKDDIVMFYTDGVVEAQNSNKEMFGVQRVGEIIKNNSYLDVEDLKSLFIKEILDFREDYEQVDDITFVIIKNVER